MYFDAVLVYDGKMLCPVFNAEREEVVAWLRENPVITEDPSVQVCVGRTLECMTVEEYLGIPVEVRVVDPASGEVKETYTLQPGESTKNPELEIPNWVF